jgi:DNA-binding NtrC family response regulator
VIKVAFDLLQLATGMAQQILIVDDEASICHVFSEFFRRGGYVVSCAGTAADAEQAVSRAAFDAVLLDISLPDEDGIVLLRRLIQLRPQLPVIVMTGSGLDEQLMRQALGNGAYGFISKPPSLDKLMVAVSTAIASRDA